MKLYFIPFTKMVIAKFPEGKWFKIEFGRFASLGIWCIILGRFMLFNDHEKLYEHHDEIERMKNLNMIK